MNEDAKQTPSMLEAEEKLLARGYRKDKCRYCDGTGRIRLTIDRKPIAQTCVSCYGKGFKWKPPIKAQKDNNEISPTT